MDEFDTETTSLWNKTAQELTVADQYKIMAASAAICGGAVVVFYAGAAAFNGLSEWNQSRKARKNNHIITPEVID